MEVKKYKNKPRWERIYWSDACKTIPGFRDEFLRRLRENLPHHAHKYGDQIKWN